MDTQCRQCMDAFAKEQIPFHPRMCDTCQHGYKLHKREMETSKAEAKWGRCDWNSSKLKEFYHG